MKRIDIFSLFIFGIAIWIFGTIVTFRQSAEVANTTTSILRAYVVSPVVAAILNVLILRWRRIATCHWSTAVLLLTLPGMFGEAIALAHLATFMPQMPAAIGGRYGSSLFFNYAFVIAIGELVTLRATQTSVAS